MIYQIKNGAVEFGATPVLRKIDFEVRGNEKIAVVGRNGCGKTTLLKLISGELELSRVDNEIGTITKGARVEIGYLRQNAFADLSKTVDEEMCGAFEKILSMKKRLDDLLFQMESSTNTDLLDAYNALEERFEAEGGYYYEKEYNSLLVAFGFSLDDKSRPLSEFSGGQLTKLAFIRLLLSKPDVLLLDEPTNHLDITTVEWLEDYLKNYKKAVVVVSHDRMFLDKVAEVVYEIEYGETTRYTGNYSSFVLQKEQSYELRLKAYKAQRAEIARLEALIERFRDTPTKVSMTDSKLKQIEHMVKLSEPRKFDTHSFKADFKPNRETGKDVLTVEKLSFGYDEPLGTVSFTLYKGDKIAIIGGNGLGKSTLVKTLVGKLRRLGGSFATGHQVDVGYFDQQMAQYTSSKTVLDDFWDEFSSLSETEARRALGAFMFTQDDVFKSVNSLSGGEKVRLALCKLLQRKPNFLILDEPTNHMDMIGKETLEKMLIEFEGSILFVSHDRYFVKKLASALVVFEREGVSYQPFTYDEYLERRTHLAQNQPRVTDTVVKNEQTKAKLSYNAGKEKSRLERRIAKINEQIEKSEQKITSLKAEMDEQTSNYVRLCEITSEIETLENEMFELLYELEENENKLKELLQ